MAQPSVDAAKKNGDRLRALSLEYSSRAVDPKELRPRSRRYNPFRAPRKRRHQRFDPEKRQSYKAKYEAYINSKQWTKFRERVLRRRGSNCEDCHLLCVNPDLHHITYDRLFHEREGDVAVLCQTCHKTRHGLSC